MEFRVIPSCVRKQDRWPQGSGMIFSLNVPLTLLQPFEVPKLMYSFTSPSGLKGMRQTDTPQPNSFVKLHLLATFQQAA